MKPEIIVPYGPGFQNADLQKAQGRLAVSKTYKNLSTVIICPTRGGIDDRDQAARDGVKRVGLSPRFVGAISGMMRPMNQQCAGPIFLSGMEVADAFNAGIEMILGNPWLSKFKYVLTVEDDNLPPPDGLLTLYTSMDEYDVVGGLYWTKGEAGQPMIYGDPKIQPLNFIPQMPIVDKVQHCNGLGMGFNLWKLDLFRKMEKPWFVTKQDYNPATGAVGCYTQDLYFYERLAKAGYRVACDNRVKVGHYDWSQDQVW